MEKWTTEERFELLDTLGYVKSLNKSLHVNLSKIMEYSQFLCEKDEELIQMISYMVEYSVWMVAKKKILVIPKTKVKLKNLINITQYYLDHGNTELSKALCDLLEELSLTQT